MGVPSKHIPWARIGDDLLVDSRIDVYNAVSSMSMAALKGYSSRPITDTINFKDLPARHREAIMQGLDNTTYYSESANITWDADPAPLATNCRNCGAPPTGIKQCDYCGTKHL